MWTLLSGCNTGKQNTRGQKVDKPRLLSHIQYLDPMLMENSGLIHFNGKLWTINDSGGDPVLFALDQDNGKVIQAILLEGARNRDWESLAQDEDYIYVCDVGNNFGRREMLQIYKVAKDSIPSSGNAHIIPGLISYSYSGRPKNNPVRRSAYDCEAALAFGDSIFLFTKDWETRRTTLYTCSKEPGEYELKPRQTYEVDGLITGVDMSPDSSAILFCGYKNYIPFIWIFEDFDMNDYSLGTASRLDFPELTNLQTEGIAIPFPGRVYISCETTEYPAAIYRLAY